MTQVEYDLLEPDVRTAAKSAARRWADVLDAEDASQEIWLRLLEAGRGTLDYLLNLDKPARLYSLNKIASQIASSARDEYEMYTGKYYYGTEEVKEALENNALEYPSPSSLLFDPENMFTASEEDSGGECGSMSTDMRTGLDRLRKSNTYYAKVIEANYRTADPIHGHSQELTRAIDALTKEMNRLNQRARDEFEGLGKRA